MRKSVVPDQPQPTSQLRRGRGTRRVLRTIRVDPDGTAVETVADRQNNVEQGRDHRSFNDIFFIEPNSPEAARIREQLEKDDKDLPSYDDVIRMCNLTTPTAAAAPATPTPTMESTSICLAALPAPPYSEVDPHLHLAENSLAVSSLEQTPSTSRAHTTSTTMV
ncbi:uncharacterized protein LOC6560808 isoform X8 [Drosophila grimshawi]|uniref:uncharacterized protein LOC6560808 isoform X8 n=1 Tax=Drosophila grimshawi TaxID=7222 RepID=UPI000C870E18|nr:uncharacterized protein LOC6560808 isoform X8 [Drosophila grimshawi]